MGLQQNGRQRPAPPPLDLGDTNRVYRPKHVVANNPQSPLERAARAIWSCARGALTGSSSSLPVKCKFGGYCEVPPNARLSVCAKCKRIVK